MKLSLILPVYNPALGWAKIVVAKSAELTALYPDMDFEVIVVNDGSVSAGYTDVKNELLSTFIRLIEYVPNKGKGEALRTGVEASSGDLVVYTDIDFPYTIDSVSSIIDLLRNKEANIVIGVKDKSYYTHVPPIRRLISRFLRMLIRLFFSIPTDDTQCGLKGFDQNGKQVFLQTTIKRYLFDLEFVFLASRRRDIVLKTQPVRLSEGVQFRKMDFSIIKNELGNFSKIFLKAMISK